VQWPAIKILAFGVLGSYLSGELCARSRFHKEAGFRDTAIIRCPACKGPFPEVDRNPPEMEEDREQVFVETHSRSIDGLDLTSP
jgi:hypothetical protein